MESALPFALGLALVTAAVLLTAQAAGNARLCAVTLRLLSAVAVAGFAAVAFGAYLQVIAHAPDGWAWFAAGLLVSTAAGSLHRQLRARGSTDG